MAPRRLPHPPGEADHDILLNLMVICRNPRYKQTRVGARNEVMDVEPDTANTPCKVGITRGPGGGTIAIVALLITHFFVVGVLFVALLIVL